MGLKCLDEVAKEAGSGQCADQHGICRPGCAELRHGQHRAVHARAGRRTNLRIALTEDSGIKLDAFRERLRKVLPERVIPWLAERLQQGGLAKADALQQAKTATFGFQPGDHRD